MTKINKDNVATVTNEVDESEIKDQAQEEAKRQAIEMANKKAVVVNIDEIAEVEARKAADAHMTASKESLKGIKGWAIKLWKHTFFDEYYRQKEVNRVTNEIKNTGNIYAGRIKDDNKAAHEGAMQGISDRFASEYDGTIDRNNGEEKKIIDNQDPEANRAKTEIKTLIDEYTKGTLGDKLLKMKKIES